MTQARSQWRLPRPEARQRLPGIPFSMIYDFRPVQKITSNLYEDYKLMYPLFTSSYSIQLASVGDTNEHAATVVLASCETMSFRMCVFEVATYCLENPGRRKSVRQSNGWNRCTRRLKTSRSAKKVIVTKEFDAYQG